MFQVQVGRYKGSYKTRWKFPTVEQAFQWYRGINIGNGYKKRIINPEGKVIARVIS